MTIHGKTIKIGQIICLALYYGFAQFLPKSNTFFNVGGVLDFFSVSISLRNVVNT